MRTSSLGDVWPRSDTDIVEAVDIKCEGTVIEFFDEEDGVMVVREK